jgi:hypothetical protein
MRLFITGVDVDGKSCLVSNGEVEINSVAPGFAIALPYATTQSPPPARPHGNADLILDDGVHRVEAGDMVVMNGVDHAWKAGPDGYRMSAVLIGTPPPA